MATNHKVGGSTPSIPKKSLGFRDIGRFALRANWGFALFQNKNLTIFYRIVIVRAKPQFWPKPIGLSKIGPFWAEGLASPLRGPYRIMVEPLLSGIVLGLVPISIIGLFVTAYLQYKRGDRLL